MIIHKEKENEQGKFCWQKANKTTQKRLFITNVCSSCSWLFILIIRLIIAFDIFSSFFSYVLLPNLFPCGIMS